MEWLAFVMREATVLSVMWKKQHPGVQGSRKDDSLSAVCCALLPSSAAVAYWHKGSRAERQGFLLVFWFSFQGQIPVVGLFSRSGSRSLFKVFGPVSFLPVVFIFRHGTSPANSVTDHSDPSTPFVRREDTQPHSLLRRNQALNQPSTKPSALCQRNHTNGTSSRCWISSLSLAPWASRRT